MPSLDLTFVGSGDAFSSGGRLQSGIFIAARMGGLLLDCGTTLLAGLQRCALGTEQIDAVAISHLHGDHFGGLPFLLLDALFVSKRTKPLRIIGPPGIEDRVATLCRTLYAGALEGPFPFAVDYTLLGDQPLDFPFFTLRAFPACHGEHTLAFSLRVDIAGQVLAYTGDTQWTEDLIALARGTDLLICECCSYGPETPTHLDYTTLERARTRLETARIILTHTGPSIDANLQRIPLEIARDGMKIQL